MTDEDRGDRGLPFAVDEYRRRLAETRARMEQLGLDALVVSDPANMNYLTGYDAWSFYVPQAVIVTAAHDPVWMGREMDAGAARATTWLDDEHVRTYSDDHVQSDRDLHPMDRVAGVVSELGAHGGRVGVEMDAYYYTARCHQRLSDGLPGATTVDATLLVNRVRLRKSAREIAYMEQAGRLASEGMRRGLEAVREGAPEFAVASAVYRGLIEGPAEPDGSAGARAPGAPGVPDAADGPGGHRSSGAPGAPGGAGGDYPAIVPLLPSGRHSTTPHLTWSDRRFREGDPVILELAGVRRRYHAPLARTAVVGEAPGDVARTAAAVVEGLEAALDAVEPGAAAEDVERAWRERIALHGLEKASRLGYACGLGYPPDWGEHTVSLRPGDGTVLEPGMTFHVIPGLWLDDFGVEISETVVVTESGARTLTDFPRELRRR